MALIAAVAVIILGAAANAMLEAEYSRWATPVARVLVWIAGAINPYRADEWESDIRALQSEGDPALTLAAAYLLAAPWLVIAETAQRSAYWIRRNPERIGEWLVSASLIMSVAAVGLYIAGVIWPIIAVIAGNFAIGVTWGTFDKDAEDGPEALLPYIGMKLGLSLGLAVTIRVILPVGRLALPVALGVVLAAPMLLFAAGELRSRWRNEAS